MATEFQGPPRRVLVPEPSRVPEPKPVTTVLENTLVAQATPPTDLDTWTPSERDNEVWRLTTLGWAAWRVCAELQLGHVREVGAALERYRESSELTDEQKRMVMVGQLDEAIARTMEILGHTHFKVHKGSLIMVPADPHDPVSFEDTDNYVPLVDDGPKLDAAKTLAVLLDRKAKLLGLDAPERHEHTILPLPPVAQAWVAQRRQIIEGRTA